jgi:hypothetical protein
MEESTPFKTAAELMGLVNGTASYSDEVHQAITIIASDLECVKFNALQKRTMKNRILNEIMKYLEE